MATYPVVHKETGETKEVSMSVPDWTRDYSDPSTMPGVGEVGEWKDKLRKKAPGWNEVLAKAARSHGNSKDPRLVQKL